MTDVAYISDVHITKKLFFSASERPRTVLNGFLECLYLAYIHRIDRIVFLDHLALYTRDHCGRGNSENNEFRPEFSEFSKIPVYFRTGVLNFDYFRTGVSNSSFGKIFGKFREIFGHSKPR